MFLLPLASASDFAEAHYEERLYVGRAVTEVVIYRFH